MNYKSIISITNVHQVADSYVYLHDASPNTSNVLLIFATATADFKTFQLEIDFIYKATGFCVLKSPEYN